MQKYAAPGKRAKTGPKTGPFGRRISLGDYVAEGLIPMLKWLCEREKLSQSGWIEKQILKEYRAATGAEALPGEIVQDEEKITFENGATIALSEDK